MNGLCLSKSIIFAVMMCIFNQEVMADEITKEIELKNCSSEGGLIRLKINDGVINQASVSLANSSMYFVNTLTYGVSDELHSVIEVNVFAIDGAVVHEAGSISVETIFEQRDESFRVHGLLLSMFSSDVQSTITSSADIFTYIFTREESELMGLSYLDCTMHFQ